MGSTRQGKYSVLSVYSVTVTNIDVSEDALVDARRDAEKEGLAEQIVFEHGGATSLRYPNGSFDVVICYGTLHHIEPEGRRKCLHELHRVAKDKVIIVEFTPEGSRSSTRLAVTNTLTSTGWNSN